MSRLIRARLMVVAALAGLAATVVLTVSVRTDLSFFLPADRSVEVQALTDGFDRSGSRIMVRLAGVEGEGLAAASDATAARLRDARGVALVQNGRPRLPDAIRSYIMAHRFLLGPDLPSGAFSADRLGSALESGVAELSTTTGWALRETFPRDPTGRFRTVLESFALGRQEGPARRHGVWMDGEGRALILLHLTASSSDVAAQRAVYDALIAAVAAARDEADAPGLSWVASGPGLFALEAGEKIRSEMTRASLIAGAAVALLILLLYRSPAMLVLIGLPTVTGVLAGMLVVDGVFGHVHGVAIAFGAVLSGVAADYPIHLASLSRPGEDGYETARRVRRPMLLGGFTTVAGLAALTLSDFPGLAQIGVLASVGVAVALAVSQLVLPAVTPKILRLPAPRWSLRLLERLSGTPHRRTAALAVYAALLALFLVLAWRSEAMVWERDLTALSVSAPEARALDGELRAAFKLPDVRRLLLVEGRDPQEVLERQRSLLPVLEQAVAEGALGGFWAAARLAPPIEQQRLRQAVLPEAAALRRRLARAVDGLPLSAKTFEPFVADVARQRAQRPLDVAAVSASPLAPFFLAPWPVDGGGWAGGVTVAAPQGDVLAQTPNARLIDLAAVAGDVVIDYRDQALRLLAAGMTVGLLLLWLGLRRIGAALRVAGAPALAIVLTTTFLLAMGAPLTLFHLLALLLVASLGVDYSLFYTGYSRSSHASVQEFRSVSVCCATSSIVFATLAFSSIPVLSAIGVTVAIGAVVSFLLTLCVFGRSN